MPTPLEQSFWDNEENRLWNSLVGVFVDTVVDGASGGVEALPADVQVLMDLDTVNQAAIDYAKQYRYDWVSKINGTTRKQTQQLISDWIASGEPLNALEKKLALLFGKARANMIAVTEVTRVFAESNEMSWKSTDMVGGKIWMTSQDDRVCPICKPMAGKVVSLGNAFSNAQGGGYSNPPAHVRCRCWLQPLVSVDKVLARIQRILES